MVLKLQVPFLAPLVTRESAFRLLMRAQSGRLRHLAILGGSTHPIAEAIERLRSDFDQPLMSLLTLLDKLLPFLAWLTRS